MTRPGSHPNPSFEDWKAKIQSETGLEDLTRLQSEAFPGLTIDPLYVDRPSSAEPGGLPAPGDGRDGAETGLSSPQRGRICPRISGTGAESEAALAEAWRGGARSVWVDAEMAAQLPKLDGWDEAECIVIEPGPTFPDAAELQASGTPEILIGEDPFARIFTGDLEVKAAPDVMSRWGKQVFPRESVRPVLVSSVPHHESGAHAALEIGSALAGAVQWLRSWESDGHDLDAWKRGLFFRFALSQDVFVEIGKLRAFQQGWRRVLKEVGLTPTPAAVHTVDARRMLSFRDPWNNMIRSSLSGFASIVGGARLHTTRAFDDRFVHSEERAERLARNTNLILTEESRLDHVTDPSAGAYYLETLTEDLARLGWEEFQRIESEGGLLATLESGVLRDRIDEAWKNREARLRRRKLSVVGVSEYAKLDESLPSDGKPKEARRRTDTKPPAAVQRFDGDPFESLRRLAGEFGSDAPVFLATLGPRKCHSARSSFARDAFAAGGLVTATAPEMESASPEDWAKSAASQLRASGAVVACICGRDEDYTTHAKAVAAALREASARRVLLAGRPDPGRDEGIDDWIHLGSDLASSLERVYDAIGMTAEPGGVS